MYFGMHVGGGYVLRRKKEYIYMQSDRGDHHLFSYVLDPSAFSDEILSFFRTLCIIIYREGR